MSSPAIAQGGGADSASTIPLDGDPAKVAIARDILDRGMPEERREAMFFALTDQMVAQMLAARDISIDDPGANEIVMRHMDEMIADMKVTMSAHIPSLMEAWAHSYANIFTTEELNDILAFVSTPSGARFLQLNPAVIAESNFAAANQAYMDEAVAKIPVYQEAMLEELLDYLASQEQAGPPVES